MANRQATKPETAPEAKAETPKQESTMSDVATIDEAKIAAVVAAIVAELKSDKALVTFGSEYSIDFFDTAQVSVKSWLPTWQQAVYHNMSNVVSSRIVADAHKDLREKAGKDRKTWPKIEKALVTKWREDNKDTVAESEKKYRAEYLDDLKTGDLGTRATGPRLDPVERMIEEKIVAALTAIWKASESITKTHGVFPATKRDAKPVYNFANGVTRTRDEMIANYRAGSDGQKIVAETAEYFKGLDRLAQATSEAESETVDPAAMGF